MTMGLDASVLEILCCPLTHAPLERLAGPRLAQLNAAIAAGRVRNESKAVLEQPVEAALVTRDGRLAYPILDGIPALLIEQGILMTQCD